MHLFLFKANEMSSSKLKNSSHSLSSQVSLTSPQQPAALAVSPTASAQSIKLKQRKGDLSPSSQSVMVDGGPAANQQQQQPCSLAIPITSSFSKPPNKQGFRFSLRRMLYNSPLVSQRRARSLSSSTQTPTASTSGGAGSTSDSKKKQSPSLCKLFINFKIGNILKINLFFYFYFGYSSFRIWEPFRRIEQLAIGN